MWDSKTMCKQILKKFVLSKKNYRKNTLVVYIELAITSFLFFRKYVMEAGDINKEL